MRSLILVAAAAMSLAACESTSVYVDYDTSADFSRLATYAWMPASGDKPLDPRLDNPLTDSRIRDAVQFALDAKGFRRVDTKAADFWLGYVTYVRERAEITNVDGHHRYEGDRWQPGIVRWRTYSQGSLILDIVDPRTKSLLWRGMAEGEIGNWTPEEKTKRIRGAVQRILSRFPPAPKHSS